MTATPRLDDQLCFALHAASRAVVGAYQPVLGALDLTYLQYLVLMILWEDGPSRVNRLGDRLDLDSGTLSPLLKRLEARGLIARLRSEKDERAVMIELTAEGKRLERRAGEIQREAFCNVDMTLAEVKELRDSLKKLIRNVKEGKSR